MVPGDSGEQRLVRDIDAPDSSLTPSSRQKTEAITLVQAVVRNTHCHKPDQTGLYKRAPPTRSTRPQDSGRPPVSVDRRRVAIRMSEFESRTLEYLGSPRLRREPWRSMHAGLKNQVSSGQPSLSRTSTSTSSLTELSSLSIGSQSQTLNARA